MKHLIDYLLESRLFEMPLKRKIYIDRVENLTGQLLTNMILVKLSSLTINDTLVTNDLPMQSLHVNHNHWKRELVTVISNVAKLSIEQDSKDKRKKCLMKLFHDLDIDSSVQTIVLWTAQKMEDEHIYVDNTDYINAVNWVVQEFKTGNIISILVSGYTDIKKYVNLI